MVSEKCMKKIFHFIVIVFIGFSCARIVAPTGGSKDETPPKPLKTSPENNSVNFKEKKIIIGFDEFIVLKNPNQEMMISPPQKNKPIIKLKGKDLIIELIDTLIPNTTYNINFYNAITDLHEGNILKNYQYIFSTGSQIDSLYIAGKVIDARTLKPEQGMMVMAWKNSYDSVPYKKLPDFYSRTDKDGNFSVNNLSPGSYLVLAIKDGNTNLLFDLPQEKIAFSDSLITPGFIESVKFDTLHLKKTGQGIDTIFYDSVKTTKSFKSSAQIELKAFIEDYEKNYLKSYARPTPGVLKFIFNKPGIQNLAISLKPECNAFVKSCNRQSDSVQVWITDSAYVHTDTICAMLTYNWINKDSVIKTQVDTVFIKFQQIKDKPNIPDSVNKISLNIQNQKTISFAHQMVITSSLPVTHTNNNLVTVESFSEDSVFKKQSFTLVIDTLSKLKVHVNTHLEPGSNYRVSVYPGALSAIYPIENDTLIVKFKTNSVEEFSRIKFKLSQPVKNTWLELTDDKDKILFTDGPFNGNEIDVSNIKPGKYFARIFIDSNNDGIWNTGNYIRHIQPEQVIRFSQEIECKPNWDYEFNWKIE